MLVFKELIDCLFLLIHVVIMLLMKIHIENISFQDLKYNKIRKMSPGQVGDYTAGCLLDFAHFEKNFRLIVADLSKQKALDVDPKAMQQIFLLEKQIIQLRFITSLNKQWKQY